MKWRILREAEGKCANKEPKWPSNSSSCLASINYWTFVDIERNLWPKKKRFSWPIGIGTAERVSGAQLPIDSAVLMQCAYIVRCPFTASSLHWIPLVSLLVLRLTLSRRSPQNIPKSETLKSAQSMIALAFFTLMARRQSIIFLLLLFSFAIIHEFCVAAPVLWRRLQPRFVCSATAAIKRSMISARRLSQPKELMVSKTRTCLADASAICRRLNQKMIYWILALIAFKTESLPVLFSFGNKNFTFALHLFLASNQLRNEAASEKVSSANPLEIEWRGVRKQRVQCEALKAIEARKRRSSIDVLALFSLMEAQNSHDRFYSGPPSAAVAGHSPLFRRSEAAAGTFARVSQFLD